MIWAKIHVTFDDPNLVSRAGLVPVMALAQRAGLAALVDEHVRIGRPYGVNPQLKVPAIVAGMIGGTDSIDDLDLLRHGAMGALFGGVRAPSTLGSFLWSFTGGNVLQLGKVSRAVLGELARRAPLLPGKDVLAFVDIGSRQKRVYGHKKQGAGFSHTKIGGRSLLVRGLNALVATISRPVGRCHPAARRQRRLLPGRCVVRHRGGSHRPCHWLQGHARGADGLGLLQRGGARRRARCRRVLLGHREMNPHVAAAIAGIPRDAWTPIQYPRAIWDDQLRAWVSAAEVSEVRYAAFTSKKGGAITARLIVRRVKDLNRQAGAGQDEPFDVWRYHAVFTDSPLVLLQAEASTATTRSWNRCSRTGPAARWPNCPRARSPPTRPGSPSPPSATTCCARPVPWPASPAPRPAGHAAPRPHRRRRPHRPPRPRARHAAPARRLAPLDRMDEPVPSRHRAARTCGLISPDPVTALHGPPPPAPRPPIKKPGQAAGPVSGSKHMTAQTAK
jgi:hypothetical protein